MPKLVEKEGRRFVLDHFIYNAPVASLAPGASVSIPVQIQADSMFTVVKCAYFAALAGAGQTDSTRVIPIISVSITDTGSGQSLQNTPVPINSLAGHDGLPMVWPQSREFNANSTIQVTFTNNSAAETYTNVNLAFIGFKAFQQ
jgi:hypothetical protein